MPAINDLRTVILYDKSRMQPTTLDAIANARDGSLIAVDRSELGSFEQVTFYIPDLKKLKNERDGTAKKDE